MSPDEGQQGTDTSSSSDGDGSSEGGSASDTGQRSPEAQTAIDTVVSTGLYTREEANEMTGQEIERVHNGTDYRSALVNSGRYTVQEAARLFDPEMLQSILDELNLEQLTGVQEGEIIPTEGALGEQAQEQLGANEVEKQEEKSTTFGERVQEFLTGVQGAINDAITGFVGIVTGFVDWVGGLFGSDETTDSTTNPSETPGAGDPSGDPAEPSTTPSENPNEDTSDQDGEDEEEEKEEEKKDEKKEDDTDAEPSEDQPAEDTTTDTTTDEGAKPEESETESHGVDTGTGSGGTGNEENPLQGEIAPEEFGGFGVEAPTSPLNDLIIVVGADDPTIGPQDRRPITDPEGLHESIEDAPITGTPVGNLTRGGDIDPGEGGDEAPPGDHDPSELAPPGSGGDPDLASGADPGAGAPRVGGIPDPPATPPAEPSPGNGSRSPGVPLVVGTLVAVIVIGIVAVIVGTTGDDQPASSTETPGELVGQLPDLETPSASMEAIEEDAPVTGGRPTRPRPGSGSDTPDGSTSVVVSSPGVEQDVDEADDDDGFEFDGFDPTPAPSAAPTTAPTSPPTGASPCPPHTPGCPFVP